MIVGLMIVSVLCIILAVEAYKLIVRCRELEMKLQCIRAVNKEKINREITKKKGEQENKTENDSLLNCGFPPPIVSLPKNFTFKNKVDKRIKKRYNKKVK